MNKGDKAILLAVGVIFLGLWLKSRPDCGLGCRTVAQHLIAHGLRGLGLG
jgi:hypothetical protein